MKIPDLTSPKVLYPALLFVVLKTWLKSLDNETFSLSFGILYFALLKLLRITFKKTDIIVMTVLSYVLSQIPGDIYVKMIAFVLIAGFLRSLFPQYY